MEGAAFEKLASELGPVALFGELNVTGLSQEVLLERGIAFEPSQGCGRTLILFPYGEKDPDDAFPVYEGMLQHGACCVLAKCSEPADMERSQCTNRYPAAAGNVTVKDVQAFVLPTFTNDVLRLTPPMLTPFMSAEPDVPKVNTYTAYGPPAIATPRWNITRRSLLPLIDLSLRMNLTQDALGRSSCSRPKIRHQHSSEHLLPMGSRLALHLLTCMRAKQSY